MGYDKPCYHTVFTLFIRVKQSPLLSKNDTIQHQFCHTTLESSHHIERNQIACNFLAAVTLAIQVWFVKGMDISMITVYLIVSYAWFSTIEISFTLISFSGHTSLIGKEEGRKHVNGKVVLLVISNSHQEELRVYMHTTGQMRKKYCLIVEQDFLMMPLCNILMRGNY